MIIGFINCVKFTAMRNTTALEKLGASDINILFIFVLCLPFWMWGMQLNQLKMIGIFNFLSIHWVWFFLRKNRCLWMIFLGTYWKKRYSRKQHFLYAMLYSLSFSSLLFWILFPFDLLLFNILFFQIPFIIPTGTTFHGYLSWDMIIVKK